MKRIIIGGFVMLGGLMVTLTIILSGAIYAPSITEWSGGSKLWFAIFGEQQYGDEPVQSLFLGLPFVVGLLFTVLGLVIIGYEYFKSFKN